MESVITNDRIYLWVFDNRDAPRGTGNPPSPRLAGQMILERLTWTGKEARGLLCEYWIRRGSIFGVPFLMDHPEFFRIDVIHREYGRIDIYDADQVFMRLINCSVNRKWLPSVSADGGNINPIHILASVSCNVEMRDGAEFRKVI